MATKVHKNLNRGCWSITRPGAPVVHAPACALAGARLVVQPGGLARVKRSGVRAVHAYAVGEECGPPADLGADLVEVTYNPFRSDRFHTRDGLAVAGAALLVFDANGRMYARGVIR